MVDAGGSVGVTDSAAPDGVAVALLLGVGVAVAVGLADAVPDGPVPGSVGVAEGVAEPDISAVGVADGVAVADVVAMPVGVGVGVAVGDAVDVGVPVAVADSDAGSLEDDDAEGVALLVGCGDPDGVADVDSAGVGVALGVAVAVGVGVRVAVEDLASDIASGDGVEVGVGVAVAVGVGVAVCERDTPAADPARARRITVATNTACSLLLGSMGRRWGRGATTGAPKQDCECGEHGWGGWGVTPLE